MNRKFVRSGSIVRKIWGDADVILLIFAGAAAEFALNKAVDWLFFTNQLPNDPIGRLFSTVRYAQEIVFEDEANAFKALKRINSIHGDVERERGQSIPDWAYRDVLYMLIDYSERSFELLYDPLSPAEQEELYEVFRRVGEGLNMTEMPENYGEWQKDRLVHIERDLAYSEYTKRLFEQYRKSLGTWRYEVLVRIQALLVPDDVRILLNAEFPHLLSALLPFYKIVDLLELKPLIRELLIQPQYLNEINALNRN
jgi:uncharacterized protein (DUF2236 family)